MTLEQARNLAKRLYDPARLSFAVVGDPAGLQTDPPGPRPGAERHTRACAVGRLGGARNRRIYLAVPASAGGIGPPVAQSSSSTVCTTGSGASPASCVMQPILPAATRSAARQRDIGELAVAQRRGEFGLQQVVGAGRTAAEMPFRHVDHRKPGGGEQRLRLALDLLAVLQRARRMIGDAQRPGPRRSAARSPSCSRPPR